MNKKTNQPKVISLDLDGTIIKREFDYCLWGEAGYEGTLWQFVGQHLDVSPREAYDLSVQLISQVPNATISVQAWIDHYQLKATEQQIVDAVNEKIETYEDYRGLIEQLRKKVGRVVLVTESSGYLLNRKLDGAGIRNDFDAIYSSVDLMNSEKNPELFQRVLELEGVKPVEIIHIGDSHSKDYIAPSSIGIRAYFIPTSRQVDGRVPQQDQITSLQEIVGKIK